MLDNNFEHNMITTAVEKIQASPFFIRSNRLKKFLSFVVNFHLDNPSEKLTAIVIASDCFDRDVCKDPNDAYVRNIASQTRAALKSYYASFDELPGIIIQLADKGYQPSFSYPQNRVETKTEITIEAVSKIASSKKLLPTLAVLPFNCLAGEEIQGVVGELISGALIADLAKSRFFHVISQRTSGLFVESTQSTQQLGHSLGSDYIVEGRYIAHGDSIRVQVELSSCAFDEVIWADQISSSIDAVINESDDLIEQMLNGVASHLVEHEVQRSLNTPLQSLQCHSLLIASANIMHRGSSSDLKRAQEMLLLLAQRNPHHAAPSAHLAYWGVLDYLRDGSHERSKSASEFVLKHSNRALSIDSTHPVALTAKGAFRSHFDGDFNSARKHYKKAILHSPNEASAMVRLSITEMFTRSASRALKTAKNAITISPFDPELSFFHSTAATAAFGDKKYEEAIVSAELSHDLSPNNPLNLRTLIGSYTAINNREQTEKYKVLLLKIEPNFNLKSYRERSLHLPKHEIIHRLTHLLEEAGLPATHDN